MATGSDAPGAKPKAPMGHEEAATPINERVTASHDAAYRDAFEEGEDVDLDASKSQSRNSGPILDLRASAEVLEIEEASEAAHGFDMPEPRGLRETDPDRPIRPPPLPAGGSDDSSPKSFAPVSMTDPRIGETLNGRYRLEKLIGKGGMGRVYRATQFPLNRPVALKILNPEFQKKDPQFVRRFYLEASTAARLTHPNTITVFDYGEAESGELFIVMEYLRGRPLSRIITSDGPFHFERVLHIAIQIARALREAHTKGIIHRDLKPGNIMLLEEGDDADFVKVLDFGLVKLFTPHKAGTPEPVTPSINEGEEPGELTRAGMFLGSPKYMSPEQIQGTSLDPRTDIYSLGVLMFQMCAGKPPFGGSTSVEVIYKHVNHPVPRIREITPNAEIPEELEEVIRQCLAKNREQRFAGMSELLVRLKDVRRLLTGASGASELGVSLAELQESSRPSVIHAARNPLEKGPGTSQSGGISMRPQTRPLTGPIQIPANPRGSMPPMKTPMPVAPTPVKEVAFQDLGDDTPSALVRGSSKAASARLNKIAPMAAGGALVLVLGVGAYVFSANNARENEELSGGAAQPAIVESKVAFQSAPAGAEVYENGRLLGTTPFTKGLVASDRERKFVFKLEGFLDEVVEEKLEAASVKIQARMKPAPSDDPEDDTYKDNPY
jgi:serine/threonine-protein kinase